jgi:hypothetical protein
MEGSVLSFLKAEWKMSDTGSVGWASSFYFDCNTLKGIPHKLLIPDLLN